MERDAKPSRDAKIIIEQVTNSREREYGNEVYLIAGELHEPHAHVNGSVLFAAHVFTHRFYLHLARVFRGVHDPGSQDGQHRYQAHF